MSVVFTNTVATQGLVVVIKNTERIFKVNYANCAYNISMEPIPSSSITTVTPIFTYRIDPLIRPGTVYFEEEPGDEVASLIYGRMNVDSFNSLIAMPFDIIVNYYDGVTSYNLLTTTIPSFGIGNPFPLDVYNNLSRLFTIIASTVNIKFSYNNISNNPLDCVATQGLVAYFNNTSVAGSPSTNKRFVVTRNGTYFNVSMTPMDTSNNPTPSPANPIIYYTIIDWKAMGYLIYLRYLSSQVTNPIYKYRIVFQNSNNIVEVLPSPTNAQYPSPTLGSGTDMFTQAFRTMLSVKSIDYSPKSI